MPRRDHAKRRGNKPSGPAAVLGFWIVTGQVGLRNSILGDVFTAGLFGIIHAAVCSWVAGEGIKLRRMG
jgi:hypothetical protein